MATCKDCIYRAMCYKREHYGKENEEPCEMFKNKADFVEVVRCKDCGSYNKHYGECTLNGSHYNEKLHCEILELENQIQSLESDINDLQSNKMFMAGQIEAYKHCIENIGG